MLSGAWPYTFPYGEKSRPFWGHWVYLLYDDEGKVCYIGESGSLRDRLNQHGRNKNFVRWEAVSCDCAAEARYYESELTRIHRPYLRSDGTRR